MGGRGRILLVEDEMIVSMWAEDVLTDAGFEIVGPVGRLEAAIDAAAQADIDIALVALNLYGEPAVPVVDALRARRIPFALMTGYPQQGLTVDLRVDPILEKPVSIPDLLAVVAELMVKRARSSDQVDQAARGLQQSA